MSSEKPVVPVIRSTRSWRGRIARFGPPAVWLAVLALVVWLYDHGGQHIRINGIVEVVTESVAPMETGRLVRVDAVQGEAVTAGQALAQMDTSFLEEELAELTERMHQERGQDERQLLLARQRIEAELREHESDLAEARIRAELHAAETARLEPLVEQGLVGAGELVEQRAERDIAAGRVARLPAQIATLQAELAELDQLRQRILSDRAAEENGSSETLAGLLRSQIAAMTLRAQQDGVVSRVRREPGEIIDSGDAVVELITRRPPRILAFMDETDTRPVAIGDIVEVERPVEKDRFHARVESISPNIIALPDRASPIPDRVVRGRRLDLAPVDEVDLTPGASMVVILPRDRGFWRDLLGGLRQ